MKAYGFIIPLNMQKMKTRKS
nr:unnamed protein product [Callosobruchus analis]